MTNKKTLRPIFIHVHVRKCGGSTFHGQILRQNFGKGFYRDASLIDDHYDSKDIHKLITCNHWLEAYSSHKVSLDLPWDVPGCTLFAIAFVRDPIERFLSNYRYVKRHDKRLDPAATESTIDEYIATAIKEKRIQKQRQHSQLEQLVDCRGEQGIESLKELANHPQLLLCPMQRFDDACIFLEEKFPASFKDCSYPEELNTSKQRSQPTADSLKSLRREIGESEFEVMPIALNAFEQKIAETFPNTAQLEQRRKEFAQRRHRMNHWFWKWFQ